MTPEQPERAEKPVEIDRQLIAEIRHTAQVLRSHPGSFERMKKNYEYFKGEPYPESPKGGRQCH